MRIYFSSVSHSPYRDWAWERYTNDGKAVDRSDPACECGNRFVLCHPEA